MSEIKIGAEEFNQSEFISSYTQQNEIEESVVEKIMLLNQIERFFLLIFNIFRQKEHNIRNCFRKHKNKVFFQTLQTFRQILNQEYRQFELQQKQIEAYKQEIFIFQASQKELQNEIKKLQDEKIAMEEDIQILISDFKVVKNERFSFSEDDNKKRELQQQEANNKISQLQEQLEEAKRKVIIIEGNKSLKPADELWKQRYLETELRLRDYDETKDKLLKLQQQYEILQIKQMNLNDTSVNLNKSNEFSLVKQVEETYINQISQLEAKISQLAKENRELISKQVDQNQYLEQNSFQSMNLIPKHILSELTMNIHDQLEQQYKIQTEEKILNLKNQFEQHFETFQNQFNSQEDWQEKYSYINQKYEIETLDWKQRHEKLMFRIYELEQMNIQNLNIQPQNIENQNAIIQQITIENSEMRQQLEQCQQKINIFAKDNQQLILQNEELNNYIFKLSNENQQLNYQILENTKIYNSNQQQQLTSQLNLKNQQLIEIQEKYQLIESELFDFQQINEQLRQQQQHSQEVYNKLNDQYSILQQKLKDKDNYLIENDNKIRTLQDSLTLLKEQNIEFQNSVKRMKIQLVQANANKQEEINSQIYKIREEFEEVTKIMYQWKEKYEKIKVQYDQLTTQNLQTEIDQIQNQRFEDSLLIQQLQSQVRNFSEQVNQQNLQIQSLNEQLKQNEYLRKQLTITENQNKQNSKFLNQSENGDNLQNSQSYELNKTIQLFQEENKQLKLEIQGLQKILTLKQEDQINKLTYNDKSINNQNEKIEKYENENVLLKKILEQDANQIFQLEKEIRILNEKCITFEKQNQSTQKEIDLQNNQQLKNYLFEESEQKNQELQKLLESKQSEIFNLQDEIYYCNQKVENLTKELNTQKVCLQQNQFQQKYQESENHKENLLRDYKSLQEINIQKDQKINQLLDELETLKQVSLSNQNDQKSQQRISINEDKKEIERLQLIISQQDQRIQLLLNKITDYESNLSLMSEKLKQKINPGSINPQLNQFKLSSSSSLNQNFENFNSLEKKIFQSVADENNYHNFRTFKSYTQDSTQKQFELQDKLLKQSDQILSQSTNLCKEDVVKMGSFLDFMHLSK